MNDETIDKINALLRRDAPHIEEAMNSAKYLFEHLQMLFSIVTESTENLLWPDQKIRRAYKSLLDSETCKNYLDDAFMMVGDAWFIERLMNGGEGK